MNRLRRSVERLTGAITPAEYRSGLELIVSRAGLGGAEVAAAIEEMRSTWGVHRPGAKWGPGHLRAATTAYKLAQLERRSTTSAVMAALNITSPDVARKVVGLCRAAGLLPATGGTTRPTVLHGA